jgi:hypothetical protein
MNHDVTMYSGFKKQPEANASLEETARQTSKENDAIPIENEPMGLDLLRCESLASLDDESRQRILAKNYSILFSMAPYSSFGDSYNSPPISTDSPFHIGPAIPEMNSVWFKLFIYDLLSQGPCSLLLPRGSRYPYFNSFRPKLIIWLSTINFHLVYKSCLIYQKNIL